MTVESHGQKTHVTEFAITGLSFEPQTVWLDDDRHFFGIPGKWFAFLREGWEDTNDQLYALDRKASDERYARDWPMSSPASGPSSGCGACAPV